MAEHTTHYNITKPTGSEAGDVSIINANMDIIDGQMYQNAQDITENTQAIQENAEAIQENAEDIEALNTYSTTEQRIGTWIDGKPLYRKVFTTQLDDTSGLISINHGLTNVNIRMAKGFFLDTGNTIQMVPSIATVGSSTEFIRFYITTTQYNIQRTSAFKVTSTFTLILEYTKTTD